MHGCRFQLYRSQQIWREDRSGKDNSCNLRISGIIIEVGAQYLESACLRWEALLLSSSRSANLVAKLFGQPIGTLSNAQPKRFPRHDKQNPLEIPSRRALIVDMQLILSACDRAEGCVVSKIAHAPWEFTLADGDKSRARAQRGRQP